MANPLRGEVELKAGEQAYVLRFSIDAICSLEERTGKGFPSLAIEMGDPARITLSLVRDLLHAGLSENHPDITLKEAGELIATAGGMVDVMAKIGKALELAFPKAEASSKSRPPRRPAAKAGTGQASSNAG